MMAKLVDVPSLSFLTFVGHNSKVRVAEVCLKQVCKTVNRESNEWKQTHSRPQQ